MFLSLINNFLFYRGVFTLRNILKAGINYICYIARSDKVCFNPVTVHFLITFSCSFSCSMCSLHASKNIACQSLTTQDIEKFLFAQKKFKPLMVFCGGEPFMRNDFVEVVRFVKKYDFKCAILSNGYLLDSGKIKEIMILGVEMIIFSLHGNEAVHEAITGVKGSYAKSIESISLACKNKSRRSKVVVSCTINKTNVDSLEEIPLIGKRLGVDAVKFEHLNFLSAMEAGGEYFSGEGHPLNTYVTDFTDNNGEFAEKLINKLTKIKSRYKGFVFVKPDLNNAEIKNWYSNDFISKRKCFFIRHSIFIRPDGIVVPCQFLKDYALGDISREGLGDIFANYKSTQLRKILRSRLLPECRRCCKL